MRILLCTDCWTGRYATRYTFSHFIPILPTTRSFLQIALIQSPTEEVNPRFPCSFYLQVEPKKETQVLKARLPPVSRPEYFSMETGQPVPHNNHRAILPDSTKT